jgi:hypothetical protein
MSKLSKKHYKNINLIFFLSESHYTIIKPSTAHLWLAIHASLSGHNLRAYLNGIWIKWGMEVGN